MESPYRPFKVYQKIFENQEEAAGRPPWPMDPVDARPGPVDQVRERRVFVVTQRPQPSVFGPERVQAPDEPSFITKKEVPQLVRVSPA